MIDTTKFVSSGAAAAERLELEVLVAGDTLEVFRDLTEAARIRDFFGVEARVELAIGGRYEWEFDAEHEAGLRGSEGCQILAYVPGEMLAFSWNAPAEFPAERARHTWVVITFRSEGPSGTRVRLVHAGFGTGGRWGELREYFRRAWPMVLRALGERRGAGAIVTGAPSASTLIA